MSGILGGWPLLSVLIWLPILGGMLVLLIGTGKNDQRTACVLGLAGSISLMSVLLCLPLYWGFDTSQFHMQWQESYSWMANWHIQYALGVDGISLPLVLLTVFTGFLVVCAAVYSVEEHVAGYLATFLIMQGMIVGIFCALDAILFYFFWEGVLIPMYLSIGIWGGENRMHAAMKFFLYTFLGSVLLLVALVYLGVKVGDFSILHFYTLPLSAGEQNALFFAFLCAFAVKVPMWPVHTWLPDAHTEAPTGGSVILAALMLKVGTYGLLRFNLPITPDASQHFAGLMIGLSLIAIVYVGLVTLAQTDMKRLIAYSSIAHMGFVTLGCFALYPIIQRTGVPANALLSVEGAMVQTVSHGFGSGALFLGFGMLYARMHTRRIDAFAGVANTMPVFAAFFLLFCLSNVGVPGTAGFVGELMVILGTAQAQFGVALLAACTLVIAAAYTLWMYRRVFYGTVGSKAVQALSDLTALERGVCILAVITILGLGIYPQPLLSVFHASTAHLVTLSVQSKLG